MSGRVQPGAVSGPPKYLTSTEEAELAKFLAVELLVMPGRSR